MLSLPLVLSILTTPIARAQSGAVPVEARTLGSLSPERLTMDVAGGGLLATAEMSTAAFVLPAAMALTTGSSTLIALGWIEGRVEGARVSWQPGRAALGYRHLDRRVLGYNEDHYLVAFAGRGQGRAWGLEATWVRADLSGQTDALTIGSSAIHQLSKRVVLATRFQHLNRPRYLDGRLHRTVGLGLAWRTGGGRLTGAADFLFREDGADDFAVRYGFEISPTPAVTLNALADNEGGFRLGFVYRESGERVGYALGNSPRGIRRQLLHVAHEERPAPRKPPWMGR